MKINTARFVTSATTPKTYPVDSLLDVAFIGRSNVGKSSLINYLANRKKLAKTSSVPGKTRLLNYYLINDSYYIVDLPGYGFTRVPASVSAQWRRTVGQYLDNRKNLAGVIQLIDIRHDPSPLDIQVSHWLREIGLLGLTVLVKIDKLSRQRQVKQVRQIVNKLELPEEKAIALTSTTQKIGREDVLHQIQGILKRYGELNCVAD
jgi:GTP-binding protein